MLTLVLSVVFFGIGLLLFYIAHSRRSKAKQAQGWPSVMGKVVESRLEQYQTHDQENRSVMAWRPRVNYYYAVAGQQFQGFLTPRGTHRPYAEKTIARFPAGSQVPVYYNPVQPAESILEQDSGSGYIFMYVMAGFFVLVSGLCFLLALAFLALRSRGM